MYIYTRIIAIIGKISCDPEKRKNGYMGGGGRKGREMMFILF